MSALVTVPHAARKSWVLRADIGMRVERHQIGRRLLRTGIVVPLNGREQLDGLFLVGLANGEEPANGLTLLARGRA